MLTALLMVPALALVSLGPGLLITRHLPWSPTERLCGAVAASLLFLYVVGFGLFVLDVSSEWAWWVSGFCAVATLLAVPDLRHLAADRGLRRVVAGYALLAAWTMALTATVRVYSGGGWAGDWLEHYQRTLFFLDRLDPGTRFLEYGLAARPPLANVITAHFLAQTSRKFAAYQVVNVLLSVLAYLPAAMLVRMSGGRRIAITVLTCLLALNPFFVQNATFPWTKLASAFYVLLGIAFYLRGWGKSDPVRMLACSSCLAAGCLAHYSAIPFAFAVALHYLVRVAWRPERRVGIELPGMALAGTAVLSTWLAWSIVVLGVQATFASNTSVRDSSSRTLSGNVVKVARNIRDTLVPHPLRDALGGAADSTHGGVGYVHDYFFLIYQPNVFAAMGMVGGVAAAYVFWRRGRDLGRLTPGGQPAAHRLRERRRFWWGVLGAGLVLGVASVGSRDRFGAAHVALQPVVLLGIVAVAAGWSRLSRRWREAIFLGTLADYSLGILVHFLAQSADPALRAVADVPRRYWRPLLNFFVSDSAQRNLAMKLDYQIGFLGDEIGPLLGWLFLSLSVAAGGFVVVLARHVHGAARWPSSSRGILQPREATDVGSSPRG